MRWLETGEEPRSARAAQVQQGAKQRNAATDERMEETLEDLEKRLVMMRHEQVPQRRALRLAECHTRLDEYAAWLETTLEALRKPEGE